MSLIKISWDSLTVNAGEKATFYMDLEIRPIADVKSDRLVIAFLAPKIWKPRENTVITYQNSLEPGVDKKMSLIPDEVSPKHHPGLTWEAALRNRYGVGPNVLDDMQWVTFWSDQIMDISNGLNMDIKVKIVTKTGPENLSAKLGFYLNDIDDGINGGDRQGILFSPCFGVIEGEGDIIDFCELHFNMAQPSNATPDDIITLKFQGGIQANALDDSDAIYLNAIAYTARGGEYEMTDSNAKTKMMKESQYGKTYSITFWPTGHFSIPENETITRIEYFFTNKDGTAWVKEIMDDNTTEVPFKYQFVCK